ncbi:MAG: hypothetical protein QMC67_05685 [Candidatus Wallbacteria bacterium]
MSFADLAAKFEKWALSSYESVTIKNHIDELQFGDIILVRHHMFSPVGWIIQLILREAFSHASLYVGNGRVFEATGNNIDFADLAETYKNSKICVLRLKEGLTMEDKAYIRDMIARLRGKKYNYICVASMIVFVFMFRMGLARKEARKYRNPLDDPNTFYCFQLVAYIYDFKHLLKVDFSNAIGSDFYTCKKLDIIFNDLNMPLHPSDLDLLKKKRGSNKISS